MWKYEIPKLNHKGEKKNSKFKFEKSKILNEEKKKWNKEQTLTHSDWGVLLSLYIALNFMFLTFGYASCIFPSLSQFFFILLVQRSSLNILFISLSLSFHELLQLSLSLPFSELQLNTLKEKCCKLRKSFTNHLN